MTNDRIPYSCQSIDQDDIDAVVQILNSEMLTQGPAVTKFESVVAEYVDAHFSIACNSATSALHLACLALDIGPGDSVWVPAISFVATANCVRYCGAGVDFVDVDISTHNICVEDLESKLIEAHKLNKLPKAVIVVHMCGTPVDMQRIGELRHKYGFKVIEDASHALGARSNGHQVGSCAFSDMTVFSFHPVKMVTTGEGGMVVTQSESLASKVSMLRSHGITSDKTHFESHPDAEIWNYQQHGLGFNYRMSDIHAALGISQMKKIDYFVRRRNEIAEFYRDSFKNTSIATQDKKECDLSSYHLFTIRVPKGKQKPLYYHLINQNIMANLHYIPIYRQPYYSNLGFENGYCPNAEQYFRSVLSIPLSVKLSDSQALEISEKIKDFIVHGS